MKMMTMIRCLLLGFIASVMVACGGGGGSSGVAPNVPNLYTTAGDTVTIPPGAFRTFAIRGGVPPYRASSSESVIAEANAGGDTLTILARAGGKATVSVFDNKGTKVQTEVTVGSSIPLYTTAPASFSLRPASNTTTCTGSLAAAQRAVYAISGGSPPYQVSSSNTNVLSVAMTDASHWEAVATALRGTATVRITDATGASLSVDFSNAGTAASALAVTPTDLTIHVGYEAEVTVTGGTPPYRAAGGSPAAIQVTPACNEDGKFKIRGNLASDLDVGFVDSEGASVKVKVTVNTATPSFRVSPSPLTVSENGSESITLSLFGFYGDTGTGASSGSVCVYSSDPSYLALDPSRTTCSTFSGSDRSFKIITGSRGKRCVSSDTPIEIRAVDTQGQVALGTITIVDVGTACETPIDGTLTLTPASVVVGVGGSSTVLISGGSGKYVASSLVPQVSASVSGSQLTVTGVGTTNNSEVDAVQITDIADRTRKVTLKVRVD